MKRKVLITGIENFNGKHLFNPQGSDERLLLLGVKGFSLLSIEK